MSRGLSASNITAVDGDVLRPVTFAELHFDAPTGTLYVHDGIGSLTADDWDGSSQTWEGVGDFGGVEGMQEGATVTPYALTLTLSGLDSTIASEVLTEDSGLREVYVLIGFMDSDRSLVDDPHPIWRGRVDDMQVSVGADSVVRVVCESHLIAFERANGRLFNDADHQAEFSGDLGFQYLEQMIDARILWGGDERNWMTGGVAGGGVLGGGRSTDAPSQRRR